jgi:hypothetical protein
LRSPSLPARDPRSRVTVEIDHVNLLDNDARARWVGDLAASTGAVAVSEEELAEEIAEAELPPDTPPAEAPVPELPVAAAGKRRGGLNPASTHGHQRRGSRRLAAFPSVHPMSHVRAARMRAFSFECRAGAAGRPAGVARSADCARPGRKP